MPTSAKPRIAIVYEPESVPLLTLAESAARNGFHLVWVADSSAVRILGRLGVVVQADGCSNEEMAERLAPLGIVGITTFSDKQIEQTAAIAACLGLPGNSAATALRLVDKIAQRQALAVAGVPGPAFVGIRSAADIAERRDILDNLRYPVVVKPALGDGGRNTFCLPDLDAVQAELSARYQVDPHWPTIVEECLGSFPPRRNGGFGDYVSVEVVVECGLPSVLAVTGRMPLADPFRETGAFLPSTLSSAEQSDVADMAVMAAHALEVRYGCLHIEIKLTAEGPRIIEVNGRVPGGGIPDLVAAYTGVDLFECAMNSASGRQIRRPLNKIDGIHYQLALQPPLDQQVRLKQDWSARLHEIVGLQHATLRSTEAQVGIRDGSYGYLLMARGVSSDHSTLLDTYRQLNSLPDAVGPSAHLRDERTNGRPPHSCP